MHRLSLQLANYRKICKGYFHNFPLKIICIHESAVRHPEYKYHSHIQPQKNKSRINWLLKPLHIVLAIHSFSRTVFFTRIFPIKYFCRNHISRFTLNPTITDYESNGFYSYGPWGRVDICRIIYIQSSSILQWYKRMKLLSSRSDSLDQSNQCLIQQTRIRTY